MSPATLSKCLPRLARQPVRRDRQAARKNLRVPQQEKREKRAQHHLRHPLPHRQGHREQTAPRPGEKFPQQSHECGGRFASSSALFIRLVLRRGRRVLHHRTVPGLDDDFRAQRQGFHLLVELFHHRLPVLGELLPVSGNFISHQRHFLHPRRGLVRRGFTQFRVACARSLPSWARLKPINTIGPASTNVIVSVTKQAAKVRDPRNQRVKIRCSGLQRVCQNHRPRQRGDERPEHRKTTDQQEQQRQPAQQRFDLEAFVNVV